jgi:hypothetical protein
VYLRDCLGLRRRKKQKSREAKKQGKAEKQKAGNQKPKKKYQNGKQIIPPNNNPHDIIDITRYSVICLILSESPKKSPRIPSLSASSFPGAAVALLCLKL